MALVALAVGLAGVETGQRPMQEAAEERDTAAGHELGLFRCLSHSIDPCESFHT
jgi:hypothetical protein